MKIYKVYDKSIIYPYSSKIYNYGYYSTLDKAKERLEFVWKEKKYPEPSEKIDNGWYCKKYYDVFQINISEIEIDKDINEVNCGYT